MIEDDLRKPPFSQDFVSVIAEIITFFTQNRRKSPHVAVVIASARFLCWESDDFEETRPFQTILQAMHSDEEPWRDYLRPVCKQCTVTRSHGETQRKSVILCQNYYQILLLLQLLTHLTETRCTFNQITQLRYLNCNLMHLGVVWRSSYIC